MSPEVKARAPRPVYNEEPVISQDGTTFTLLRKPLANTIRLHKNGLRLRPSTSYTVSNRTVTLLEPILPDDEILADYHW